LVTSVVQLLTPSRLSKPFSAHFGDQLQWLEEDLSRARKDPKTTFIIVVGHRPMYCSSDGNYDGKGPKAQAKNIQHAFEEMFHKHDVTLFVTGHVHAYERTTPIYRNRVVGDYHDPKATTYIVNGAAGCREGFTQGWHRPHPEWSVKIDDKETGYGVLDVQSETDLTWTYFGSESGRVIDSFKLHRSK
jgi:acid phosphatase type 7